MPEFRVLWSRRSLKDLQNIFDFAAQISPDFASVLILRITSRENQLVSHPQAGRIEDLLDSMEGEYRFVVEGNHKIIYRIVGGDVVIARVFDTRQDPGRMGI